MRIRTANTIIYCRKWRETVEFYKDGLGLAVTFSNDWFVEFELNATARLSVANEKRASIKSSKGKGLTITLEVDDLEEVRSAITDRGLQPTPIKDHPWGARVLHLFDPEGNRLEFWTQGTGDPG